MNDCLPDLLTLISDARRLMPDDRHLWCSGSDAFESRPPRHMRALCQNQPLAVNVTLVAGHDSTLNQAVKWKGRNEATKTGKFQVQSGDDGLHEDQTGKR